MCEYRIFPARKGLGLKTAGLVLTVTLLVTFSLNPSLAQSRLELDCLALAASPLQPDLPAGVVGLPYDEFDAQAALPICEAAMAEAGTLPSPRLAFPMGRVYHKLGRYEDAIAVYMKYENAGYGPILSNLGVIYEDGTGQPANLDLAFDYFRRAGQAGLLNGWLNALALLDRPDAPASVKPNLAEVLRQVVATSGDANAAYRLAEAIASGQIAPATDAGNITGRWKTGWCGDVDQTAGGKRRPCRSLSDR
jgi:tetratricopeptide (TPR) repeat protein